MDAIDGLNDSPPNGRTPVQAGAFEVGLRDRLRQLVDNLSSMVVGQGDAVRRLVHRLALTRRSFDLRPERPDAVLLLLGLTGVGKSHLARWQ